jgi:hypothetical protein
MRLLLTLMLALSLTLGAAACGGGGDGGDETPSGTGTARVTRTGTAAARTGTPGAPGTAPGMPTGAAGTAQPSGDPANPGGADDGNIPPGISGGSAEQPRQAIATPPPPPPGVTPHVDPTEIAPPQPQTSGVEILLDLDAATPGIQSSREVRVGDVIRAAVVISNSPGVANFNFTLRYDKTKLFSPTITGGPATDRNPDLNVDGLGGAAAQWECLPAPAGDLDDIPDNNLGDKDPNVGQAFLSCFTFGYVHRGGTHVLATIEFQALAAGDVTLSFTDVAVSGDSLSTEVGSCNPVLSTEIPCVGATLRIR